MPLELIYTPAASNDIDSIYLHISQDSPNRADRFVREIESACENLCHMPGIGTARPDLRPALRLFFIKRRVVIAYEANDIRLDVLRILYGGRNYEDLIEG